MSNTVKRRCFSVTTKLLLIRASEFVIPSSFDFRHSTLTQRRYVTTWRCRISIRTEINYRISRDPTFEIRSTPFFKFNRGETNHKSESQMSKTSLVCEFFDIRALNLFRISDFVLRLGGMLSRRRRVSMPFDCYRTKIATGECHRPD